MSDAEILGLDHVQLAMPVGAEEEARRYFGAVLGLAEIPKPPALAVRGGLWFRCGVAELHVGGEAGFRPARKAHPAFRLASADAVRALRARLEAAGVLVRDDHEIPGVTRFFADDPWGNRLEFTSRG